MRIFFFLYIIKLMAKLCDLSLLLLLLGYLLSAAVDVAQAANVLAVLPSVWKSHYLFGQRLLQQLVAQQNFSVTVISPHAEEYPVQYNIRQIRIEGLRENWQEMGLSFDVEQSRQKSIMERFTRLIYAGNTNVDLLLGDAQVRKLLRSGEKFDLLVVDLFLSDSLLGLALFYDIPTVVLSPTGANTWLNQMLGNPQSSALDPSNFLRFSERMNIWQRSINTLMGLFEKLTYNFFHMISQEAVYNKHFQSLSHLANTTLPHHRELTKNLSLVLINSHPIVQYPRAYLPNMLEIAGVHLHPLEQLELPNHIKYFIEAAPKGTVYISLGADARTADLAREKLDALLDVITYLNEFNFLLKWELQKFYTNIPSNLMIADWWPQEAILAHPNVKVFISTCGLMSVVESVNGVTPLLAIPIYPEQENTAQRLQTMGIALTISFEAITYDAVLYGIQQLTLNESFSQCISEKHNLLNSDYGTPIARTLHYIDLVLQTKGAQFLKSHANELNFMRAELVDVIAIIILGLCALLAVPFFVTLRILRISYYTEAAAQTVPPYHATLKKLGRTQSYSGVPSEGVPVTDWRRGSNTASMLPKDVHLNAISTSSTSACSSTASSKSGSPLPTAGAGIGGGGGRSAKLEAYERQQSTQSSQQSD